MNKYQYSYFINGSSKSNPYYSTQIQLDTIAKGTFVSRSLNIYTGAATYYHSRQVSYTITETGNLGQYLAGTFTGQATLDSTTTVVPVSGSFRIRITQ
ncbi:hypothetical protein CLV51_101570 [Chitinophaga niastensis]|uniref:Uncharacterized protein n=1 Tax=Chitinophaga niastensis TaxID=536980 RepID=A0A2P8HSM8_CHINA|nr:hypothetical protein [Chitinophaga niastensis]PSL49240.1 hypothetical protein CLV51_101570 [Chitinophaga niastensis]